MQEDKAFYLDAKVEHPTPQQLFPGCDGIYNWNALSEEQKAMEGWVKFDPPLHDDKTEKVEYKFSKNKQGVYTVQYTVVALDTTENVVNYFKSLVAAKRWEEEIAGTKTAGIDFVIPTTTEAIAKISSIVTSFSTGALAKEAVIDFNIGANTIKRNQTEMLAVYSDVTKYVQDCHSRQAEMYAEIDKIAGYKTKNATHLQEYINKELDKGWPNSKPEEIITE